MDEYSLILGELEKFNTMKEQIRKTEQRKRTDLINLLVNCFRRNRNKESTFGKTFKLAMGQPLLHIQIYPMIHRNSVECQRI